jgi:hypothetical protein
MILKSTISRQIARFQHAWLGHPEHVIFFGYGIGDDLLCTTVAHELKRRGAGRLVMFSRNPTLFEQNPDIGGVFPFGYPTVGRLRNFGYSTIIPQYGYYDSATDKDIYPPGHFLEIMCRRAGITGEIELRPYLYLRPEERTKGQIHPSQAVIQSAGQAILKNKEWLVDRYQAVADNLRGEVQWIQLGTAADPPIQGAFDLRGKTSQRESAAILASSHVFLGQAGFLMHLARAVDCGSIIVYGGREDPLVSGYRVNENIVGRTTCSFCWQRIRCDYGHECMKMIGIEEVTDAVRRQLKRFGTPLEMECVNLDAATKAVV